MDDDYKFLFFLGVLVLVFSLFCLGGYCIKVGHDEKMGSLGYEYVPQTEGHWQKKQ